MKYPVLNAARTFSRSARFGNSIAEILPRQLAISTRTWAFLEPEVTLCVLVNTEGDIVVMAAGQARDSQGSVPPPLFLDRLEGLAIELALHGLNTRLMTPAGRVPSLHVVNPLASRLAEDVYVGRSQDGLWWFWWPWAERIAPGDDMKTAARLIARVLAARDLAVMD
jgi:hypothetical protein